MSKSFFSGKIKVGKCLLTNIVGKVPTDLYGLDNNNFMKSFYYQILDKTVDSAFIEEMLETTVPIGIGINAVQLKILVALLKILTKYNYNSNLERCTDNSMLRLRVGVNEFVKMFGCGNVKGNTRKRILENLEDLSEKNFLFTYRLAKKTEELIVYEKLVTYKSVNTMGRKFFIFDFHEVFKARIDDYYALLPDDFVENIIKLKATNGKKNSNVSQYEIYLYLFLLSQVSIRRQKIISIEKHPVNNIKNIGSAAIIRTNFAKLAFQLRMLNSLEKGFWSSIRQKIREYLKRAEAIGYIKGFSEDKDNDSVTIEINIDKVFVKKQEVNSGKV